MILAPSLLSADLGNLAGEMSALETAGVRWAHMDVMDGVFVPNITFGAPVIKALRARSSLFFDVHLMIVEPERSLDAFQDAGADMLVVHVEATRHIQRTLTEIRRKGMEAGLALNPATPLHTLDHVLDDVDMVLLMSVNPGFSGQHYIPAMTEKIRALRHKLNAAGKQSVRIQVDGGINPANAGELVRHGADVLVSGSAFFSHPPYDARLKTFIDATVI